MSKFLLVDVGAGTMDVLYLDEGSELHYKAVVKSPVRDIAHKAAAIQGNLLVTGCEMCGGTISDVLKERAGTHEVVREIDLENGQMMVSPLEGLLDLNAL